MKKRKTNFELRKGTDQLNVLSTVKPAGWAKVVLYGLLLLGVYFSTFSWLITKDWNREDMGSVNG